MLGNRQGWMNDGPGTAIRPAESDLVQPCIANGAV